ncbi:MAG: hypothetical protein PSX81_14675 [bacterium]|nr:hypothetical protein [bacterium]
MLENATPKSSANFIFASILTGVYDVNRNENLQHDDFSIVEKWVSSIVKLKLNGILFHNTFSKETVDNYANKYVQFVNVEYNKELNPNIYRYYIYQDYISKNLQNINNLFVTDVSDVEVVANPFESPLFKENPNRLFCGDEPEILDNEWMRNHCNHLRDSMPEFRNFEALNQYKTLLNCGIIGANINVMKDLFDKMLGIHDAFSYSNSTDYTLDMGVFNYVARTHFGQNLFHGEPVNTCFKNYEIHRTDCWFRHK